jgi:hypothetical protein
MEWSTLLATLAGGAVALSSSLLVDRARSHRGQREQWLRTRLEVYVDFLAELSKAYESLWALAREEYEIVDRAPDAAARLILRSGGIFQTRQRLIILASQKVRSTGDMAFNDLMKARSVVGAGARSDSPEFKAANLSYRSSMDALREAIRGELNLPDRVSTNNTSA